MTRSLQIQLALAVLTLLVTLGAYVFAYHTVGKESATATALITDIQAKTLATAHVAQAKKALSSLESEEAAINHYLIQQTDIVTFLESVQRTGSDLGAHVTVVSVTNDTSGGHPHLALSLQITGSFDAVFRTIGALEYGPYDSMVQSLTLDSTATDKGAAWTASGVFFIGSEPAPNAKKK